jgi:hypothetical protein
MAALKTIDEKGRLTVGRQFAGRTVEVKQEDDALILQFRAVVPDREAWLWQNEVAKGLVGRGLAEARNGLLTDGPDLAAAFSFAESIPEEE